MNFAQPLWLIAGLIICITFAFLIRNLQERRKATLAKFVAPKLLSSLTRNISSRKRRTKNILIILAIFMCFVALARPQYGFKWVEVKRKGIDILFALDTSKSMQTEDVKPNRLKRAHYAILDFVRQLEGDRVGLLPFAGSSFLMCPLTLDYDAFEHSLSVISTDIIPQGGTDIAAVIKKAVETLDNAANHKILILISDGENLQGDALKAATEGAEQGLTVYTVGVGTKEGELIPLSGGGFVKNNEGNFVTSKLDEHTLLQIAEKSGGLYVPLGNSGEGLETVYQQKLALIPKDELAERRHKVPLERFEWPLALALFFLICDFLISERKSNRSLSIPLIKTVSRRVRRNGKIFTLILFVSIGMHTEAHSSEGEDAYSRGEYIAASEYYSELLKNSPDDPQLHFNYGTAAYKNNMFDDAIGSFTEALKSTDINLQQKAYYNRGNAHFFKGKETLQADTETTIQQWQQALESMQAAIELSPEDENSKANHDLILQKLEELKKQQEEKEQEQDQQDNKEGKKKDDQKDGQQKQSDSDNQQSGDSQEKSTPDKPQESSAQNKQESEETKADDSGRDEQAAKDAMRQQLGKMTKEEAERLLNALKNEEGELNFVPAGRNNRKTNNSTEKDW